MNSLIYLKKGGIPDSDLDFFMTKWSKWKKGWVEQEFVLLIIARLQSEAGLPNE